MKVEGLNIGLAVTGSFCTFDKLIPEAEKLVQEKANVYPIFSTNAASMDTRFGKADYWLSRFEEITGNSVIKTIADAEPIGPEDLIDILVIAPCTGNGFTNSKLCLFPSYMLQSFLSGAQAAA